MNEEQAGENQKRRAGRKIQVRWIVLLCVVVIGGSVWLSLPPKEPSYHGKSLSYWLARAEESDAPIDDLKNPKSIECREAVRAIGTNAIPVLLRILRAKDSALKMKLMDLVERQDFIHLPLSSAEEKKDQAQRGFYLLGDIASNSIPALIDICTNPASPVSMHVANGALMELYPLSDASMPYWVPKENQAQWYLDAGEVRLGSGSPSKAIFAFSQAIRLEPTNTEGYLRRGVSKYELQDFAGAIPDFEKVMELSPSNYTAFFSRGLCKFALKDFTGADADFTKTINLDSNNAIAYNNRGLARANKKELKEGLTDINKAIEMEPQLALSFRNRAEIERLQRKYELALADVSKSIDLDARDANAYTIRGLIKSELKDYKSAVGDFDKSIEIDPKDSNSHAVRADACMYMHDFSGATADLEKALRINPKNAYTFLIRGVMKVMRGGEEDAALADLKRAVELAPEEPETYGILGLIQYKTSDWTPALANCRKALDFGAEANISDFISYVWLIRAQSGEEDSANKELDAFLKTLDGAKTNEWCAITARFFIGSVPEAKYLDLATTSAKRPSAVKGQVGESLYYAGMKRKLAGDKQGAAKLFQKCLDTGDDISIAYINAAAELRALKKL